MTDVPETNIALMTALELEQHIQQLEQQHRVRMKSLRALMRARGEEWRAKELAKGGNDESA